MPNAIPVNPKLQGAAGVYSRLKLSGKFPAAVNRGADYVQYRDWDPFEGKCLQANQSIILRKLSVMFFIAIT